MFISQTIFRLMITLLDMLQFMLPEVYIVTLSEAMITCADHELLANIANKSPKLPSDLICHKKGFVLYSNDHFWEEKAQSLLNS